MRARMKWTTKRPLWVCVRPNGTLLSFYPHTPQIWHRFWPAHDMLYNPKHKVSRVAKVKVTFEEIE
jgi:hypothetical protein